MEQLTAGLQALPILPSRSYCWLALSGLPLLNSATWLALATWIPAADLRLVGVLTFFTDAAVLALTPAVRRMPTGWRSAWGLAGGLVATIAGAVLSVIVVYAALVIACRDGGCLG